MYYHVARLQTSLLQGQIVPLVHINEQLGQLPDGLADFAYRFLLGGVSRHGLAYLGSRPPDANLARELALELVRRESFPDKPSRFQCVFAWTNLDDARTFAQDTVAAHLGLNQSICVDVWSVATEADPVVGDMNLLNNGNTWLEVLMNAERYWQGEHTPEPQLEVLLPLPIRVTCKVGHFACYKRLIDGRESWGATLHDYISR